MGVEAVRDKALPVKAMRVEYATGSCFDVGLFEVGNFGIGRSDFGRFDVGRFDDCRFDVGRFGVCCFNIGRFALTSLLSNLSHLLFTPMQGAKAAAAGCGGRWPD